MDYYNGGNILNPVHGTGKIPGYQSAENSQCNGVWNTFQRERIIQVKLEHGFRTCEQIRNRSCRHTGNQQGKQRSHGQVNHQHLQRKDHTGNRCLEDTRNRPGGSTSHQQHQRLVVHTKILPRFEPMAEPVSTIGASAPTDPPQPMVMAEANTEDQTLCRLIRLCLREMAYKSLSHHD